jgi:hypothetical protein
MAVRARVITSNRIAEKESLYRHSADGSTVKREVA